MGLSAIIVEEMEAKCLQPGDDILLLVSVWCISLASQVLCKGSNEMKIIELHSANRLVTGWSTMAGKLLASSCTFPVLCSVVSISLDTL
jgi:hypothetical protein